MSWWSCVDDEHRCEFSGGKADDFDSELNAQIFDGLINEKKNLWLGVSAMNEEEKEREKIGECGRVDT